ANTQMVELKWCRGFVIEDCAVDSDDETCQNIRMTYCLDCHIRGGNIVGKKTSVPAGSTANQVIIRSSQACTVDNATLEGGNQGVDITYVIGDLTNRGGPSIAC